MAPYRGDAFREMEDINRRFSQLIQTFFGDTSGLAGAGALTAVTPPVDIEETEDAYIVDVDLPNVRPEDVTIEMRGEELRISGRVQQRERAGIVRRQSRPTGEFEYVVDLPSDIDPNRVDATYDNGVLTVTVGKTKDAQPRRIEIREARGQQRLAEGDEGTDQTGAQPADQPT
jgi:HSP20 family protein